MKTNKITSFVGLQGSLIIVILADYTMTKNIFAVLAVIYLILHIISDE